MKPISKGIKILAPAKVNLFLEILEKGPTVITKSDL